MTRQENNRRYKLHQRIKGKYRYEPQQKTVYVPFDDEQADKAVNELKNRFNYNIQTEIPC